MATTTTMSPTTPQKAVNTPKHKQQPSIFTPAVSRYVVLAAAYALYAQAHIKGYSPTAYPLPLSEPKRPFLLHEFSLPYLLLFIALFIPVDQTFRALLTLPPLAASWWQLLGAGSSSPGLRYGIGMAAGYYITRSLELLVFRDLDTIRRYDVVGGEREKANAEVQEGEAYPAHDAIARAGWVFDLLFNLRGIGWNWCCRLPAGTPATPTRGGALKWVLKRVIRALLIYVWLDIVVCYVHYLDHPYFIPEGHATGFNRPAVGLPVPGFWAHSTTPIFIYPMPAFFPPLPAEGWQRITQLVLLQIFRTIMGLTAMVAIISGVATFAGIVFVLTGALTCSYPLPPGWKSRWFAPAAWPTTFGDFFKGELGKGVRGFWGIGWHHLFRNVFTAPAGWLVRVFGMDRRGPCSLWVNLTVPFVVSGLFHQGGAWSLAYEGWGANKLFLQQPMALAAETLAVAGWRRWVRPEKPGAGVWLLEFTVPYIWAVAFFAFSGIGFFEEYRYVEYWSFPVVVGVGGWLTWEFLGGAEYGWMSRFLLVLFVPWRGCGGICGLRLRGRGRSGGGLRMLPRAGWPGSGVLCCRV